MDTDEETSSKHKRKSSLKDGTRKRKRFMEFDDSDTESLEKRVVGDASYMLRNLCVGDTDSGVEEDCLDPPANTPPVWVDDEGISSLEEGSGGGRSTKEGSGGRRSAKEENLRNKFTQIYGQPSWATLSHHQPQDEDQDNLALRRAGKMVVKLSSLAKGFLDIKRLPSLNNETRNEGPVIKSVEFHPSSTVALVAGHSGTASIFQVDGRGNNKLASVQFERFPIKCARFSVDGNQFVVGSHQASYFYVYDMIEGATQRVSTHHTMEQTNMKNFEMCPDGKIMAVAGRFGQIHLLSAASKEWIGSLSMNGNVTALAFSPDGSVLYSHGELGEVYVWDLKSRSLMSRFYDEGCLKGTALVASEDYLATGSSSGVVNLYSRPDRRGERKSRPLKAFMNLVTSVSSLRFDSSQQMLAMASDQKDNQLKMVHVPSLSVFSNFPTSNGGLWRVQALAFSPASGYFACANNKYTAFLYRLRHFGNY